MSERKNNDNSNEEQHATDAINKHLNQISSEIAHRVHPNVDFFEGHLHAVKESSELTIAKLEEVKMFLNKCGGALKTSSPSLASEKDIRMISERLERDFAFVDSAEATLKTIDERVSELEREIWESEKALLRDAVETKVGALRENFGRMFSGISSSFGGGGGGSGEGGGGDATTTNRESSSSVDFEDAEKLRREVTKTKDTKDEKNKKQTLETSAKEKDDDNDNNNNNNNNNDGYYFGDDDEMGQVSPQKKETTGGLFGNFFNKSSSSSTTTTKQ